MTTTINADNVTGGAIVTGDASGQLGLQAAGVTKLTVSSSGVTLATPLPVASGGTGGSATPTAGGIVYGTGTVQAVTAAGTSGQYLQSNAGSAPTWSTVSAGFTLGTPVSVSGTSIDFTGIPAGTKQIVVSFSEVSISTSWLIRLGDSGGIETTGYTSANTYLANGTTPNNDAIGNGFGVRNFMGYSFTGGVTLTLIDAATFLWGAVGSLSTQSSGNPVVVTTGKKALSSVLTQIRLTTSGGTDNFTSGTVNIAYI